MGKFDGVKIGDQLMRQCSVVWPDDRSAIQKDYFLVTDCWFDPCKGQYKTSSGEMVAVQQIDRAGDLVGSKRPHTRRGLASNGYLPADCDYMKLCADRFEAMKSGDVVGIGAGRRNRPRPPGRLL